MKAMCPNVISRGEEPISKSEAKLRRKLNVIKSGLELGQLKTFEEIFSILSETRFGEQIGISFYTLRKKIDQPVDFRIAELIQMASVIGTEYSVVHDFVAHLIFNPARKGQKTRSTF